MAYERRVLIVDDSTTVCKVIDGILRNCGFSKIEAAHDGQTALEMLKPGAFNLVISDWEMSPMSGLDLLRAIRSEPKTKNIPFILMSAQREMSWILGAKKAGASSVITKPFTAATLAQKIREAT